MADDGRDDGKAHQEEAQRSERLVEHALRLLGECRARALLVQADAIGDAQIALLQRHRRKVILAVRGAPESEPLAKAGFRTVVLPGVSMTRTDQAKAALLLAITRGLLRRRQVVVCLSGPGRAGLLDTLQVLDLDREFAAFFARRGKSRGLHRIHPDVFERILSIASELGREGREGLPAGALFVIGDAQKILPLTRPMVLNPFQGYPEQERNVLEPRLKETVKSFASLDGAFLVREDGVIVASGVFLVPAVASEFVPLGLGARHQAAAAITLVADCVAVAVSQTTGTVSVFRQGRVVTEIGTRQREAEPSPSSIGP